MTSDSRTRRRPRGQWTFRAPCVSSYYKEMRPSAYEKQGCNGDRIRVQSVVHFHLRVACDGSLCYGARRRTWTESPQCSLPRRGPPISVTSGSSVYVMKLYLGSNLRRHLLVRCGAPVTNVTEASVMLRSFKEPPRQKVSRLVVVTMKLE